MSDITHIPLDVYAPCLKLNLRGAATLLEQITDGADIIYFNNFGRNFLQSKIKVNLSKKGQPLFVFIFERFTATDSIVIFTN